MFQDEGHLCSLPCHWHPLLIKWAQNQKKKVFKALHVPCHVGTSMKKTFSLLMQHTKTSMVRRETCLLGMDCDKGQFSLEKLSHVIIGSHLSPMESSNLKMTFHLFLSLELAKKINTQHCYKQLII
jgi:hypothetical protein